MSKASVKAYGFRNINSVYGRELPCQRPSTRQPVSKDRGSKNLSMIFTSALQLRQDGYNIRCGFDRITGTNRRASSINVFLPSMGKSHDASIQHWKVRKAQTLSRGRHLPKIPSSLETLHVA